MRKKKQIYNQWWFAILIFVLFFFVFNSIWSSDTRFLKEKNYEVLDHGFIDMGKIIENYSGGSFAYLEMKGFGSRGSQVQDGMFFLQNKYSNADEYDVTIFTESEECRYVINGDISRAYWSGNNSVFLNKKNIEKDLDYVVWKGFLKLELMKMMDFGETEREYFRYEIDWMMDEYEKLNNSKIDKETIRHIYKYTLEDGYCE